MTGNQFRAWRQRLGLTQAEAAERLGLTTRSIIHFEIGSRQIRRTIELACVAVELGYRRYERPKEF